MDPRSANGMVVTICVEVHVRLNMPLELPNVATYASVLWMIALAMHASKLSFSKLLQFPGLPSSPL
jgi:hypothetical protein